MNKKRIDSSKLGRLTKFGASLFKATSKYAISRAREKSEELIENSQSVKRALGKVEASKELINSMGELKGGLMKIGQMLSLTEGMLLPPEISEMFKELQKKSPSMPDEDLNGVFLNNFGKLPEEVFAEFNRTPFAAASIGQVHKGKTHSGESVAIKIQYPEIQKAIDHDFQIFWYLECPNLIGSVYYFWAIRLHQRLKSQILGYGFPRVPAVSHGWSRISFQP